MGSSTRNTFPVVGFVARAASGKSESLTAIKAMPPAERVRRLHMGEELVILDDFPYVHLMRRIDEELCKLSVPPMFYPDPEQNLLEPHLNWKLLILLLNQDYWRMRMAARGTRPDDGGVEQMLARIDRARQDLGVRPLFFTPDGQPMLGKSVQMALCDGLLNDVAKIVARRDSQVPRSLDNTTVLLEFARGGVLGAKPPLPYGYGDSFSALDPDILSQAVFLYLKVTPEQAVIKNFARVDPSNPASILGHCVPLQVMYESYGSDDFEYLLLEKRLADEEDWGEAVIAVGGPREDGGQYVPAAVFDNRGDLTSFVRQYADKPWEQWPVDQREALTVGLEKACRALWRGHDTR